MYTYTYMYHRLRLRLTPPSTALSSMELVSAHDSVYCMVPCMAHEAGNVSQLNVHA